MRLRQILFYIILSSFFIINLQCLADRFDNIFANRDYMLGNELTAQKITLVNGKYIEPRVTYVNYTGYYTYGDFNGDGLQDAAVILTDSGGGSAAWYDLAFLIKEGEGLVHKNTVYLGDRVDINSISEKDGKVVIDMTVRNYEDWANNPRKRVTNIYEYPGPIVWGPDNDNQ